MRQWHNRSTFLSIQAQDFIEDGSEMVTTSQEYQRFLSIQAQDFIEDRLGHAGTGRILRFLSIQAQDFIEEGRRGLRSRRSKIPEHSSSGLH